MAVSISHCALSTRFRRIQQRARHREIARVASVSQNLLRKYHLTKRLENILFTIESSYTNLSASAVHAHVQIVSYKAPTGKIGTTSESDSFKRQ